MASLAINYDALLGVVGHYLGYGRTPSSYTTEQYAECDDIVQSGLRNFYWPMEKPTGFTQWSFLKVNATLNLAADDYDYDLPSDFGGFDGPLTMDAGTYRPTIQIVDEIAIRALRQHSRTGTPEYGAVRPKRSDGTADQAFEIILYPTPDTTSTVHYRYAVNPPALTTSAPYPLGGVPHHETILESCLAVAESRSNDESGIHQELFLKRLSASFQYDLQQGQIEYYGYNGDYSDVDCRGYYAQ